MEERVAVQQHIKGPHQRRLRIALEPLRFFHSFQIVLIHLITSPLSLCETERPLLHSVLCPEHVFTRISRRVIALNDRTWELWIVF